MLSRMAAVLESGGYLFLSSTEAMPADVKEYEPVKGAVRYFKKVCPLSDGFLTDFYSCSDFVVVYQSLFGLIN